MIKADLHIHSSYSDGSDSLEKLVENIKAENLDIFALTDHDLIEGCKDIRGLIPENIQFIPGVELTCKARGCKCHILGYNYNPDDTGLNSLIAHGKLLRRNKLEKRIAYLKDVWNITLTEEELDWLYSRRSVVKIHLANILVNRGLSDNNIDAMKKYLDGCKTGNSRFDGDEAIQTIKSAGGIAVWAHPLGGEGEVHLTKEEFLPRLETLIQCGIQGLECYYSRYTKEEIEFLVQCAHKYNLLTTGGSDYHGSNKDVKLAQLNIANTPVDAELFTLLHKIERGSSPLSIL